MGNIPHDLDMCTSATPNEIIKLLNTHHIYHYEPGLEFGTVIAKYAGHEYEITTYRSESDYMDSRHPSKVEFIRDLKGDLSRRDFTINAMAFNPLTKEFIDMFNGISDIDKGLIRTVGNSYERFKEDPLRIIRALRFAIRYNFEIDNDTSDSMQVLLGKLDTLAKERITMEIEKILTCGKPVREHFLKHHLLIERIFPEIKQCYKFNQYNKYHTHDVYEHSLYVVDLCKSNKFEIKLAALLHDIGKPSCFIVDAEGQGHFYGHPKVSREICEKMLLEQLRLSKEQYDRVLNLIEYHDMGINATKVSVKRALNKLGEEFLRDWFILKQADMDDHVYPGKEWKHFIDIPKLEEILEQIKSEEACFKIKDLAVNGNDIMREFNLKPSKQVGFVLNALLDNVIEDKLKNEYTELIEQAGKLVNNTI